MLINKGLSLKGAVWVEWSASHETRQVVRPLIRDIREIVRLHSRDYACFERHKQWMDTHKGLK